MVSSTTAVAASRTSFLPGTSADRTAPAVAAACEVAAVTSFSPCAEPATKMPSTRLANDLSRLLAVEHVARAVDVDAHAPAIATASGSPTCGGAMTTRSNSPARSRSRSPILRGDDHAAVRGGSDQHAVADLEAHGAHVGRGLAARGGSGVVRPAELAVEGESRRWSRRAACARPRAPASRARGSTSASTCRQGRRRTHRRSGRARCACGAEPSGRRISPPVGPSGLRMRSNSHVVMTLGRS